MPPSDIVYTFIWWLIFPVRPIYLFHKYFTSVICHRRVATSSTNQEYIPCNAHHQPPPPMGFEPATHPYVCMQPSTPPLPGRSTLPRAEAIRSTQVGPASGRISKYLTSAHASFTCQPAQWRTRPRWRRRPPGMRGGGSEIPTDIDPALGECWIRNQWQTDRRQKCLFPLANNGLWHPSTRYFTGIKSCRVLRFENEFHGIE